LAERKLLKELHRNNGEPYLFNIATL